MSEELTRIGVLIAIGLVWLLVNIKAGYAWLKWLSFILLLAFLGMASWRAVELVGLLP